MIPKLSKSQLDLLRRICFTPRYCADYYKPAQALVKHELAIRLQGFLYPTYAGLDYLRKNQTNHPEPPNS